MIKFENTDVYGFEAAIRGMRNPMNSWDKSDSVHYSGITDPCDGCPLQIGDCSTEVYIYNGLCLKVGDADIALMRKLAHAGDDHGKFARFINVTVDIVAPLYWWLEFDTYKIGTVANSCSKMHKIHDKEFSVDDFSHEHLDKYPIELLSETIRVLNVARREFLETKDKKYWWYLIQLLPLSYNQKHTMQFDYHMLSRIYRERKNNKLDEWNEFCAWIEKLPYFRDIYC